MAGIMKSEQFKDFKKSDFHPSFPMMWKFSSKWVAGMSLYFSWAGPLSQLQYSDSE
jgi:hypothetical protein